MPDHHADIVIVGASHAGSETAIRLRQNGFKGSVALIGAETELPYNRPPLSKAFLAGELSLDQILIRPRQTYEKVDIAWHGGTTVTAINRNKHDVVVADGRLFGYQKLVLATGGRPRRLTVPGADLRGIYYLRDVADVDKMRPAFTAGKRLVIVGGGYIGLEVAAVAIKHGLDVEIVEFASRVLARVAGPELSAYYETAHRQAGVKIRLSTGVDGFAAAASDSGHVGTVLCSGGITLAADLVLVAVGLIPNIELAEEAGLAIGSGIIVDEYCQTSDPDILAIGDCTEHPLPFLCRRVRLESVPNALEQARVAASVLTSQASPYNAVPWFWSDQYDLKLQAVGLSQGHDTVITRPAKLASGFIAFYLLEGRVIAADCVNAPADFMQAKRIVTAKQVVDPILLADPSLSLKDLFAAAEASGH
jgi:3-phenylpropionate/trans-cinnamate dioxygenase ferredoxin reductase subunit